MLCPIKKSTFVSTLTLAVILIISGCAGKPKPEPVQTAFGVWHTPAIHADGQPEDWPDTSAQYMNAEKTTQIWVNNNAQTICLLAEIKNPDAIEQLSRTGFTLSMQTGEKQAGPFTITLKGNRSSRRRPAPENTPEGPGQKPPTGQEPLQEGLTSDATPKGTQAMPPHSPVPDMKLPDSLVVVYPFSSNPMTMSMKEARVNGIALGFGNHGQGTLIFEAAISLDALFFDAPQLGSAPVTITLSTRASALSMRRPEKGHGNNDGGPSGGKPPGGQGPGGGPPPGHGASGPDTPDTGSTGKKPASGTEGPFRAAIQIILAAPEL